MSHCQRRHAALQTLIIDTVGTEPIHKNRLAPVRFTVDRIWFSISTKICCNSRMELTYFHLTTGRWCLLGKCLSSGSCMMAGSFVEGGRQLYSDHLAFRAVFSIHLSTAALCLSALLLIWYLTKQIAMKCRDVYSGWRDHVLDMSANPPWEGSLFVGG